jgi:hypothetical protein
MAPDRQFWKKGVVFKSDSLRRFARSPMVKNKPKDAQWTIEPYLVPTGAVKGTTSQSKQNRQDTARRAYLKDLPQELLQEIAELAVAGSSATYRALSLTCRSLRDAVDNSHCLQHLPICLDVHHVISFHTFLQAHPGKAEQVRSLWTVLPDWCFHHGLEYESSASSSIMDILSACVEVLKLCVNVEALGCNVEMLNDLACSERCGSLRWLSVQIPFGAVIALEPPVLRELSYIKTLHVVETPDYFSLSSILMACKNAKQLIIGCSAACMEESWPVRSKLSKIAVVGVDPDYCATYRKWSSSRMARKLLWTIQNSFGLSVRQEMITPRPWFRSMSASHRDIFMRSAFHPDYLWNPSQSESLCPCGVVDCAVCLDKENKEMFPFGELQPEVMTIDFDKLASKKEDDEWSLVDESL